MNDEMLVAAAWRARERAYAPYSGFAVGAAVLSDSGRVYTGGNVENASYGLTACAERVAVFAAVAAGERSIRRVAIAADSDTPLRPCGACLQVVQEFAFPQTGQPGSNAGDETMFIVSAGEGQWEAIPLSALLPQPFSL